MVMDDVITPPKTPPPLKPFSVTVPAVSPPNLTLNVVADVVPAVILWTKPLLIIPVAVEPYSADAANALAVESWNNAKLTVLIIPKNYTLRDCDLPTEN